MKLLPRSVVGGRVLAVEVVHHLGIEVEPVRVDVGQGVDRLDHPVVTPDVGQVAFVITTGGGDHVQGEDAVEFLAVVKAQCRSEDHVPKTLFALRLTVEIDLEVHQRDDRVQRHAGAKQGVIADPDQPWGDGVGAHAKIHREFLAVVAAQVVGFIVIDEQLPVEARWGASPPDM